jgi:DNA repair protein RecO (recombination protein O)
MRVDAHPCYVLHQRPYRETSLLLEVLSGTHGRTGVIARGAKRKSGGATALLQPFQRLILAWSGRGELGVLVSVEPDGHHLNLQAGGLLAGFYLNELILRLLHRHDPHPELFAAYETALQGLHAGMADESVLRLFEFKLLQSIGYGLVLDRDVVTGEPVMADRIYRFEAEKGPVLIDSMESGGVHGQTLLELARGRLESTLALQEAKKLLRTELGRQLGGRPLASRSLYQAYLNNLRGNAVIKA